MTPRNAERLIVAGPAGDIEVVVDAPAATPLRGLALVCHPHPLQGGTLDNKVVHTLAKTFHAMGYVAIRFNFRGVGGSAGSFDQGIGETEDALAVLRHGHVFYRWLNEIPALPLLVVIVWLVVAKPF